MGEQIVCYTSKNANEFFTIQKKNTIDWQCSVSKGEQNAEKIKQLKQIYRKSHLTHLAYFCHVRKKNILKTKRIKKMWGLTVFSFFYALNKRFLSSAFSPLSPLSSFVFAWLTSKVFLLLFAVASQTHRDFFSHTFCSQ